MSLVPQATKATSAPVSQSIIKSKGDWFSQLDEQLTQEVAKPVPNQEEVLRSVQLLFEDGQVIELRAPATNKQTQSGYYDDFQKFAKDAAGLSSQESVPAVYWTLQKINSALLSRSENRIKTHAKFSTTDAEIIEYRLLPLDCDPVRPAHISSSDEEKDAALRLATAIRTWLSERNIPTILADSGNGYHALVRIQLPVNKDTTALVQGILAGMAQKFSTDVVKVDRKTFNPSRILKAYGTVARKGDHTADRPWRVTSILDFPEGLRTVEENELRSLLAELPKPVQNKDKISDSEIENKAIKIEFFMAEAGISHRGRMDYMGGFKWQLEACPFNPDHVAPDSFTFISADGPIGFSCSHNSCAENKWKQFRALLEKRIGHRFPFADTQNQKPEFTGHLAEPPVPPAGIPQPSSEFVPTSCTADTIQPKQIRWLWLHRFAEKINLLVGNPDNGKGLVSLHTVARLTTGEPWFDAENKLPPSEALILAAEDDWDDIIVPRLIAAGADLKKVHKLVMSAQINGSKVEKELSLDRDRSVLDNYLQKHPSIRLVVIDPVSNYLGRTKMIDEQSVRELLAPFKEMASRLHVAFLCIMHLNKKVELDAIHRIGGAMAFTGIARMVWLCAPKPNEDGTDSDEMLMVKVKGNIVQRTLKGLSFKVGVHPVPIEDVSTEIPYVEWKGAVNQSANDLMSSHKRAAHRPNDRRQEAINWLNEYLSDGAKPLDEVEYTGLKMHGFDPKLLQRARKDAGIVTFADGSKRKGRDGKNRDAYSCRLPETLSGEVTNQQGAF